MMDDTHTSRASDAAATRKRRSSILKSQRPPRTPFSELEFNVATPTDTSKSRRVSFSRRTGVAEFATNEATTTWKNFYEEHNKSMESSGNDTGNARPPGLIGHIGKRIFDQQFEEVEAVDFTGSSKHINMSASLNNFEQQLASLECTDDLKLTAPQNRFELSAFTNQTKVFSDDLAVTCIGEVTDRMDVNFSNIRQIGETDDLDEIHKDLQAHNFRQPYPDSQSLSEYIEVDLNTTHVALKNDDDMSITDTIHSPKVQEVSKNTSVKNNDLDWAVDKENIAVNPYVAPRETDNFAINEEPDKVLVFDGKRLTIQTEIDKENFRQTVPPKTQRKTIVLNVNDDLPNFLDDQSKNASGFIGAGLKHMVLEDMSITQPLSNEDKLKVYVNANQAKVSANSKRQTILYEDASGNLSVTQGIPTSMVDNAEKRRTIVYDSNNGDLSITQAVPTTVQEKRQTIVFNSDISVTQAVPTNIMPNEKRRTITYEENAGNLSITQIVPNIVTAETKDEKRRTIVYENDTGNISITQAIPSNIINAENPGYDGRRRTVVFESDTGNISVTQAVSSNLIFQENINRIADTKPSQSLPENNRRRTIIYEKDTGNLSITQAVSSNISRMLNQVDLPNNNRKTIVFDNDDADISVTQAVSNNQIIKVINESEYYKDEFTNIGLHTNAPNKRRTVVFNNEDADISMTQAVSSNKILSAMKHEQNNTFTNKFQNKSLSPANAVKRRTVVFDNEDADISITQAVPVNQILDVMVNEQQENHTKDSILCKNEPIKRRTIVFDNEEADISVTQAVSANKIIGVMKNVHNETSHTDSIPKRRTVVFSDEDANISITQAVPMSDIINFNQTKEEANTNKRRTVIFDKDKADISIRAVDANQLIPGFERNVHDDLEEALNEALHTKRENIHRTIVFNDDLANISIYQNSSGMTSQDKRTEIVFKDHNIALTLPANILKINDAICIKNGLNTSKTHDFSLMNIAAEEDESSRKQDISFNDEHSKVIPNEFIRKSLNVGQNLGSLSKPIPSVLANVKAENHVKFMIKDANKANSISDVIVFQAATSLDTKKILNRTVQGDSSNQEPNVFENDEKLCSPDDIDVKPDNAENTQETDSQEDKQSDVTQPPKSDTLKPQPYAENIQEKDSQENKQCDVTQPPKSDTLNPQPSTMSQKSKSIVDDLLDMSSASIQDVDKSMMAEEVTPKDYLIAQAEPSNDNVIEITNDYDNVVEVGAQLSSKDSKPSLGAGSDDTLFYITKDDEDVENVDMPQLEHSPLALEYKEPALEVDLQIKLDEIKQALNETAQNRLYEKILSTDSDKIQMETIENKILGNNANTEDLSDLDKSKLNKSSKSKSHGVLEEESDPIKEHTKNENTSVPRRSSLAPGRKSMVLSNEDLLNNISKAGEALKPQLDFDSELDSDTNDEDSPKNRIGKSHEVVKTLKFDDSVTENGVLTKTTPLKKTAFGETSYMQERKVKVIPSFLKDVSDNVKALMDDLVKPFVDASFEANIKKAPSTCSTQIQANIITSSQIDIVDSYVNLNQVSSNDIINDAMNRSMSRALKCPITHGSDMSYKKTESKTDVQTVVSKPVENSRVLIFDHNNPLNNVILAPDAYTDVHKYDPGSIETICVSERSESIQISQKTSKIESRIRETEMSTQYLAIVHQSGDPCIAESQASNLSKPISIDQSIDVKCETKDNEINTDIVMKGNKELLEVSSSLTLVDDALTRGVLDIDIQMNKPQAKSMELLEVIYAAKHDRNLQNCLSNDDEDRKSIKRFYSPTEHDKSMSDQEMTPKPKSKVKKLSTSPDKSEILDKYESSRALFDVQEKRRHKKRGTSLTVQHLMTEYNIGPIDHESLDERIKDAILDPKSVASVESQELDSVSFSSSKNLKVDSSASQSTKSMGYQADVEDRLECESSVNVVAKLDMLPFMGSHDCEWESSIGDTWSFLLLHGRLRLCVRLAHRVANALRTRVRADTPTTAVTLETVYSDEKNNIARLCVHFCAETMRFFIQRGCATAGDVPALLRRCAATARRAAMWGRLMCEARLRLACACDKDGGVTLKVANIPLRSVWEVTLQLELVTEEANETPWVRAGAVRVRNVLSARGRSAPRPSRTLLNLPRDWSHAPRAIWRIFKYLKNKTIDDEELFEGHIKA